MASILREAGTEFVCIIQMSSGLSPRRLGCVFRPVHVTFVADKVTLGQVFLQDLLLSPVSIILTVLHARMHLHVAVTRRSDGRGLGTFQNAVFWVAFYRQVLSRSLKIYVTDRLGALCYTWM